MGLTMTNTKKQKQNKVFDKIARVGLLIPTILAASIVVMIIIFITEKGIDPFVAEYPTTGNADFLRFITGTFWFEYPNIYGVGFIIINTLYVVLLAALIAVPISVFTALFITKLTPKPIGRFFQIVVELLAAIPSIVFGVFGLGVITKVVLSIEQWRIFEGLNLQSAGGISTLAVVIVLAIMIMPTITIMSVTAIQAVRRDLEENSLALGATKMQTLFKITIVDAKSGIFAGAILGIGRALGEATAVSMVAGNAGGGPVFGLFDTTRTLTSTMLMGIKETSGGLDYDIRFSVGIVLIIVIIVTNLILNFIKKKIGRFS